MLIPLVASSKQYTPSRLKYDLMHLSLGASFGREWQVSKEGATKQGRGGYWAGSGNFDISNREKKESQAASQG